VPGCMGYNVSRVWACGRDREARIARASRAWPLVVTLVPTARQRFAMLAHASGFLRIHILVPFAVTAPLLLFLVIARRSDAFFRKRITWKTDRNPEAEQNEH
jgi:hypothetical protein